MFIWDFFWARDYERQKGYKMNRIHLSSIGAIVLFLPWSSLSTLFLGFHSNQQCSIKRLWSSETMKIKMIQAKDSQWMSKTLGQNLDQESHRGLKVLPHRLLINYKKEKEKSRQWRNLVGTRLTKGLNLAPPTMREANTLWLLTWCNRKDKRCLYGTPAKIINLNLIMRKQADEYRL